MSTDGATATVAPADGADGCDEDGCSGDELLARVDPDGDREPRVLCPRHRVEYLREVSNHE